MESLYTAYGKFSFSAHKIEDMIRVLAGEELAFGTSNVLEEEDINKPGFCELVKKIRKAGVLDTKLCKALVAFSKLRNELIHALIPRVGLDLQSISGCDQIEAFLEESAEVAGKLLWILDAEDKRLKTAAMSRDLLKILTTDDISPMTDLTDSQLLKILKNVQDRVSKLL
jgi:hypothetical protein